MIKYFSSGYLSRYILLLILGLLIWIPSLLYPSAYTGIPGFVTDKLSELSFYNYYLQTVVSFILTLMSALLLNKIAIDNGISGKVSTLIALIYLLITSSLVVEFHNNPVIWINFILVFILGDLMRLPHVQYIIPVIFNASFLLGVASLFYSPLLFFIIFLWIAIVVHRVITLRTIIVTIVGIVLPYVFLLTWFFFNDNLLEESYTIFNTLIIDVTPVLLTDPLDIAISVLFVIIAIVSTMGVVGSLREKNINLRRNLTITLAFIIIAFLNIIIFSKSATSTLLLSIPISVIIGHWLGNVTKLKWYNITLLLITILIISNQYLYLLFNL